MFPDIFAIDILTAERASLAERPLCFSLGLAEERSMIPKDHDDFARDILSSLHGDPSQDQPLEFVPKLTKSRNAANAMAAILCNRLFKNTAQRPNQREGTTYSWKNGTFNCRNIADRGYLWTNIRRTFADKIHSYAQNEPVAYLLACCEPTNATMNIWALPEPLLHDSLASLHYEDAARKYTVEIFVDKQRIERYAASPDSDSILVTTSPRPK